MESVTEFLPPIIYLGADRYVRSSSREEDEHNYRNYLVPNDYLMPSDWQKSRRDNDTLQIFKQIQIGNLASQIRAFEASITQEFINSQSFGLRSSEQIIQRVLRDVSAGKQNRAVINKTQAIKQLQQLKEDAIPAFQYGFDSVEPIDKTLQLIESVAEEQWQRVSAVVGTYVETNLTKYGYLIALSNRVTEFLHELSSYFLDKEITFSRREGLNIKNKITNTEIAPAKLSSGERQLITMFALVSIRRQEPTVVLIDEPEISLSSLWQRKLSKSFSVVSDKEQTQFLIATHSIEILSDKANKVVSPVIREF